MIRVLVLGLVLIICVVFDLKERRIPNWATLSGLGAGVVIQLAYGGLNGLVAALGGVAVGAALMFLPYISGWVGGGDLKLLAAVGALMGSQFVFWTAVFASLVGGIMALGWLAVTGNLANSLGYVFLTWRANLGAKPAALTTHLCFGPALAMGALIAFAWTGL